MARPKLQSKEQALAQLSMLEGQAWHLSNTIIGFGAASDPMIFSSLASQFLHTASRLRKLRIKLGIR